MNAMKLYFMRHATAEELGNKQDKDRKLTDVGREQAKSKAAKYKKIIGPIAKIISSPYPRALETAKILSSELQLSKPPLIDPAFIADASAIAALRKIKDHVDQEDCTIVVVGHEPMLTQMTSLLLTGNEMLPIRLKKAGLVGFQIQRLSPKGGRLICLR